MTIKLSLIIIISLYLPVCCFAQNGKYSLLLHQDVNYLQNMQYGSKNPTSISGYALNSVTDININFRNSSGAYRLIDQAANESWWTGSMYGIQKIGNITFEGDVSYENGKQNDKKWNSTLYIADDNPFIVGDSITGDYNVERFKLNGGFSYQFNDTWRAGLRAVYEVGSSADQTDPRPDIKGMRFLLNPGVDYKIGNFTIGASVGVRWLSESVNYTLVKTYETYQLFLFRGMGNYETQQAIGYQRRYTGTSYQGNLQFTWNNNSTLANFLELGYEKSTEEATDGSTGNKYKGGKYDRSRLALTNRFRITAANILHNISIDASTKKIDGTWYIQTQSSDADGNSIWIVKDASTCHIENQTNAAISYRMDLLKDQLPHLSWEIKGGMNQSKISNYPEEYLQKYTSAFVILNAWKNIKLNKVMLSLHLSGEYNGRLSSTFYADGLKLKDIYSLPAFELVSASYCAGSIGAKVQMPLTISSLKSWIGITADYTIKHYLSNYSQLDGANRNQLNIGVNLSF